MTPRGYVERALEAFGNKAKVHIPLGFCALNSLVGLFMPGSCQQIAWVLPDVWQGRNSGDGDKSMWFAQPHALLTYRGALV